MAYRILTLKMLFFLVFISQGKSQDIVNGNFELWENEKKPVGWSSSFGSPGFRKTTDAFSGQYAAEIHTWYSKDIGSLVSGIVPDAAEDPYNNFRYGGFELANKPVRLTGYYKLTNDVRPGEDNAFVMVLLKKFNVFANKVDTIEFIKQKLIPTDKYSFFEVSFNYTTAHAPDSILIGFYSQGLCNNNNANPTESGKCLYLKVDDLKLDFKDTADKNNLKAYPIPFNNDLYIEYNIQEGSSVNISIVNCLGQTVKKLFSSSFVPSGYYFLRWQTFTIPPGVYFCVLQTSVSKKNIKILYIP